MPGTICLLSLVTFLIFQTVQDAAAEQVDDLNRVNHLSRELEQRLYKIRVLNKFDIYLDVHLLMVRVIADASKPIHSAMKVRATQQDMRTIRTGKRCLTEAEKKLSKLTQQVYINEVGNCAKDFVAKYEETSSSALELSYKFAQTSGHLYRAVRDCKSNDDKAACISAEAHAAEKVYEELELSRESMVRERIITIKKGLEDLHSCFESTATPTLQSAVLTIQREFSDCVGR